MLGIFICGLISLLGFTEGAPGMGVVFGIICLFLIFGKPKLQKKWKKEKIEEQKRKKIQEEQARQQRGMDYFSGNPHARRLAQLVVAESPKIIRVYRDKINIYKGQNNPSNCKSIVFADLGYHNQPKVVELAYYIYGCLPNKNNFAVMQVTKTIGPTGIYSIGADESSYRDVLDYCEIYCTVPIPDNKVKW